MALWTPRLIKPADFVRADLAHPQARELAFFLHYVGRGTFFDAVSGKIEGTASGQSALAAGEGNALHFGGTTRSNGTAFANPLGTVQNLCTVIAKLRLTSKPATRAAAVHYGVSGNGSGPYVGFDSNGFAHGGSAGTNGTNASDNKDATDHIGQWVVVAGSWYPTGAKTSDVASHGPCLWVNGTQKFSGITAAGGASTNAAPNTLALGREIQNYNNFFTGDVAWAVGLNRLLSDDEHAWWAQHACEVLEQRVNRAFFSLPAASGSVYGVTASESASASDTPSGIGALVAAIVESLAGSDSSSSLAILSAIRAEATTAADNGAGLASSADSKAEPAAASDASSDAATLGVSAAESANGADTASNGNVFTSAGSDTATTLDSASSLATLGAAGNDANTAADSTASLFIAGSLAAEAAAAGDSATSSANLAALAGEIASAIDAALAGGVTGVAVIDVITALDSSDQDSGVVLVLDLAHAVRAEARRIAAFAPPRNITATAPPRKAVAFWGADMETFSPAKSPGAQWTLAFTFNRALKDDPTVPDGWTIDPNSFAVEVVDVRPAGKDTNPSAILNGEAARNPSSFVYGGETIAARQALFQSVTGGTGGCIYRLKASCTVGGGIGPFELFAELPVADVV